MDESEWLAGRFPLPMLESVLDSAGDRQLRLFACACCRRPEVWRYLHARSRTVVAAAEEFVDDRQTWERLVEVAGQAPQGRKVGGSWRSMNPVHLPLQGQADRAVQAVVIEDAREAALQALRHSQNLVGSDQCDILRDIFRNPFQVRLVSNLHELTEQNEHVRHAAHAIYADRAYDRLAGLADLLVGAGCNDLPLIDHMRSEGPHVRGCWALDCMLYGSGERT